MEVYNTSRKTVRYLRNTETKLSKTLEKLSSGYKINRAGDDTSIAMSERMRLLMTGLGRANENSLEGIRLTQVGEGALQEIQTMLDRARLLAGHSSNGTYQDEIDRDNLQKELDQICSEIDRITKDTRFGDVELFQDKGYEYETTKQVEEFNASFQAARLSGTSASSRTTQSQAVQSQERAAVNSESSAQDVDVTVTVEHDVKTTQTPSGTDTSTGANNITLNGTPISDVLRDQIVPNTVKQVLSSYPAFSYLTGSKIDIGLNLYSDANSSVQASVEGTASSAGKMTYTLNVNVAALKDLNNPTQMDPNQRSKLEGTIAHEMIHAFMDEATTNGMFGDDKFPDWFVEGMAQTASGPDNWLGNGGLGLSTSLTADQIEAAINVHSLGSHSTASQYGTGYLACMYLGASIAKGGNLSATDTIDANTVQTGLNKLLNAVIGGKSLNNAISELTHGKFTSYVDFQTKFNDGTADNVGEFVLNLLKATGNGMGGLVSGDLTDQDLIDDTVMSGLGLFDLDTTHSAVENKYPPNYPVYTGGSARNDGIPPTGFQPTLVAAEYGDFVITGATASDIVQSVDSNGKNVWTIKAAGDIKISMNTKKTNGNFSDESIVLEGTGKVTLDNVLIDGTVTAKNDTKIEYEGKNDIYTVTLAQNTKATFEGDGQLKIETFNSDATNTITLNGGAFLVGTGSGSAFAPGQIQAGKITMNNAIVGGIPSIIPPTTPPTAPTDDAGNPLASIAVPWKGSDITGGNTSTPQLFNGDVRSVTMEGHTSNTMLDAGMLAHLWLNMINTTHRVTFKDEKDVSKTYEAVFKNGTFQWQEAEKPFTVSGGVENTDYQFTGDDGQTLEILTDKPMTISGGSIPGTNGTPIVGQIKVKDGIGTANLTLDGVKCDLTGKTGDAARAFDLGDGNTVNLTIKDGTENTFISGGGSSGSNPGCAGISVGKGTKLTIDGTDNGKLNATGGYGGAGIGRDHGYMKTNGTNTDKTASVTIKGGTIVAAGGYGGAGIGGGTSAAFGNIEITGGNITASSKAHGAGIGGGWSPAPNGTITISGGVIDASSPEHGSGIGAGCGSRSEKITIKGNAVIKRAQGGKEGAGIGASWTGASGDIEISGDAVIENATGGDKGAGIGAGGSGSRSSKITIDTTGTVKATGGTDGVGIGSGYGNSSCGDIEITQGTVIAKGSTDSTGIGAGRGSSSGNITLGSDDPNKITIISAEGGMTHNGGNIMAYPTNDHDENKPGKVEVHGNGTSIRPGTSGEGLYSTSGVTDGSRTPLYSYPLYLFEDSDPLDAAIDLKDKNDNIEPPPLPAGATDVKISSSTGKKWVPDLKHDTTTGADRDGKYAFLWMEAADQDLTISYKDKDGNPHDFVLALKYYQDAGVFRTTKQTPPPKAVKPGYTDAPPVPDTPDTPNNPPRTPIEGGGIILQIGAEQGEILEVPRFYLSSEALGLGKLDISTQANALDSISTIENAVNRISSIRGSYGAINNRLEHNRMMLSVESENLADSESRIRDTDFAREYTNSLALDIQRQAAQAMAAQSNQDAAKILDFFQ